MPNPRPESGFRGPQPSQPRPTALSEVVTLLGGERFPKCESPSLRLEKFVRIGGNSKKDEIADVVACHAKHGHRIPAWPTLPSGSVSFTATLGARLIINQAGGILENAGLCLHRHFGDPYIPGSAVKGIARHAAWCEWQEETNPEKKRQIAQQIVRVFGYPTGDQGLDSYVASGYSDRPKASAGGVSFLQAVPEGRVELAVDIVTPHGGNDWSDPIPNPFPVVNNGAHFRFVIIPQRACSSADTRASELWLKRALGHQGAGAKTTAGYGWFMGDGISRPTEKVIQIPLKLISPAFLRGASDASQGELRVATLRGMLRWWWRYLFRSIMTEAALKQLESEVWGSASTRPPQASMITLRLIKTPIQNRAMPFDKEAKAKQMPRSFNQNRTAGIAYLSYGMDERSKDETKRRSVLEPGAEWTLELTARANRILSAEQILEHAKLAITALCNFGGVGSRSRKGFGSLDCGMTFPDDATLFERMFKSLAGSGITTDPDIENPYAYTTSLAGSVMVKVRDAWQVLDRIGYAIQSVASSHKHEDAKAVLGLPRQIHGPRRDPLPHQRNAHTPPVHLQGVSPVKNRLASPLCVHLAPVAGGFSVNLTAFPSSLARREDVSTQLLQECIDEIANVLAKAFPIK